MDRLHGGVKAHGPAPEQGCTLSGCATVDDLLDFTLTTQPTDRKNRGTVHGKQQGRAVQKHDRQHVEGVVEQVAVAQ